MLFSTQLSHHLMRKLLKNSLMVSTEYLSDVKFIETHARAFLQLNISAAGSVWDDNDVGPDLLLLHFIGGRDEIVSCLGNWLFWLFSDLEIDMLISMNECNCFMHHLSIKFTKGCVNKGLTLGSTIIHSDFLGSTPRNCP